MADNCSSYKPQGTINGFDPDGAAAAFAGYGACTGANALINGVIDSAIVQSIESAIQEGTAEAAQLTGTITMGLSVLSDAGVDIAAASSVVPVIGFAAIVVLSVANALEGLFGDGPQIFVPNPNASSGNNTVAWNGSVWEKVSTKVYVTQFITNAMNWLNDPTNAALAVGTETTPGMTPAQFSAMHNVFLDSTVPAQLVSSPLDSIANPLGGQNQYEVIASSNNVPPGAYEMLRAVQLPVAAAVVAAMPTFANYLTAGDRDGVGAPLLARFPALQPNDMMAIFQSAVISGSGPKSYASVRQKAVDWTDNQCPPPSAAAVQTKFNLPYSDACEIIEAWAWAGQSSCNYSAPICAPQAPVVPITGGDQVGAGAGGVFGTAPPTALTRPSATGVLVGTAAFVGIGVLLYHVFVSGYTFYSTGKAVIHGAKAVYGKTKEWVEKRFHHGHRRNPIQLERKSATGGRDVAYRVDLDSDRDRIALTKSGAILFRNERLIAKFKASKYQKTKIRSGTGEVLIFTDQLT